VLTLADATQVGQVLVYRDVTFPGGVRTLTSTFYALPVAPRLAVDRSGAPAWSLFLYRAAPGVAAQSGGLLLLTITLGVEADPGLAAQIRAHYGLAADAAVDLADVPVDSATAQLWLAGAAGGTDLARTILGGGPAQLGGAGTSFAVELTADGAALMEAALTAQVAVVEVAVDLVVRGCLDQDRVRVWCDVDSAAQLGPLGDRGQIVRHLLDRRLAGCEVTASDPGQVESLTQLGESILTDAIGGALAGGPGLASSAGGGWRQHCDIELTDISAWPVPVSCAGSVNLPATADVLHRSLSTFDIDRWPPPLAVVTIRCVGDLTDLGVDAVEVTLIYAGATVADLVLHPGDPPAVARFNLASPDQRAYRARVDVHYHHEDAPYVLELPDRTDETLVLDADAFGVLAVRISLLLAPPALIRRATVELVCDNDSSLVTLDAAQPTARWRTVVRDHPASYRYRVTWVTDTASVTTDWTDSDATNLELLAPDTLLRPAAVEVISAGNFDGVASLLAELRDAPDAAVTTLSFAAAGITQTWPHTAGPYQYRRTTVLDGQPPMVGSWRDNDQPLVIVSDETRVDVTIVARLLDLGATLRLATVELAPSSAVDDQQTLVLAQPDDCPVWTYRPAGDDRGYRYRLTLIPVQGEHRRTEWHTASSSILVLTPHEAA
jgi:hypothetical protein